MREGNYQSGHYWRKRSDMMYYRYIDFIMRCVAKDSKSMIDVGSGNSPYLEWFSWIPERVSVDIRSPYVSKNVKGIEGDILKVNFEQQFDVCTCFQVLEHVREAKKFAHRLQELGKLLIVSVPYKWTTAPRAPGHIHDPVDYKKLTGWMGREANYRIVVQEPFSVSKHRRLIALYDVDENRKFGNSVKDNRIID